MCTVQHRAPSSTAASPPAAQIGFIGACITQNKQAVTTTPPVPWGGRGVGWGGVGRGYGGVGTVYNTVRHLSTLALAADLRAAGDKPGQAVTEVTS